MAPPLLLKWIVKEKHYLTKDVFVLKVNVESDTSRPTFRAGQYMSVVIPGAGPGGRNLRRAYSIASPPEWNEVELCVKEVEDGPGTTYLRNLNAGETFEAQMPFGDFFLKHDQTKPTLFIGTGTGIAPLRSMVLSKEWLGQGRVGFLLGVRHESDILYPELFEQPRKMDTWQQAPLQSPAVTAIALSRPTAAGPRAEIRGWNGFQGRVTDYMRQMDWPFSESHYYLCGNGAMIAEVKELLMVSHQVPKEQIHTEKYY